VNKFEDDTASDLAAAAAAAGPAAATTASDLAAAAAAGPAAASSSSPKRKNQKHRSDVYTVIKQDHNQDKFISISISNCDTIKFCQEHAGRV
jgi:hypothetical protein